MDPSERWIVSKYGHGDRIVRTAHGAEFYRRYGWTVEGPYVRAVDHHLSERARWVRAFNRLEKAVTNHIADRCIDSDDLAHVHKAVMRDLGPVT